MGHGQRRDGAATPLLGNLDSRCAGGGEVVIFLHLKTAEAGPTGSVPTGHGSRWRYRQLYAYTVPDERRQEGFMLILH